MANEYPDIPMPSYPAPTPDPIPFGRTFGTLAKSLIAPIAKPVAGAFTNLMANSPSTAAILAGLGAGGLGYGTSYLVNKLFPKRESEETRTRRNIGITAGTGILGALSAYLIGKEINRHRASPVAKEAASAFMGGPDADIIAKISQDFSMTSGAQESLAMQVMQLQPTQKYSLLNLLSGVSGAAIGLIISRFLLKMGFTGQVLLTLAGGFLGSHFGGPKDLDLGRSSVYGESYNLY